MIEKSSSIKSIFKYNWLSLILSMIGLCFKVGAELGFTGFTQKILDTIVGKNRYSINSLIIYSAICISFLIIGALLEYYCWTDFKSKALEQYRANTYKQILNKNISAFNNESVSTYLSSLSNDLWQILDNYIEMIPFAAELVLSFIGTIVMMIHYDLQLAGVAFVLSLIPLFVSLFRMKEVEQSEEGLSIANSTFLCGFSEMLRGFRTIKSLKAESRIENRLHDSTRYASKAFGIREHVEIAVAYTASFAGHITQIAFFFFGMFLAQKKSNVSVGIIVVFIQLMKNISQLGISMPEIIAKIKSAKKLMDKNDKLLLANRIIGHNKSLSCKQGIVVNQLSYNYNDSIAGLNSISCNIASNGCYAIVGESGSGKSTFLKLLSGEIKDYSGEIRYDNIEIQDISYENMAELISVVYQDVFIFDASIRDNITLFGSVDDELVLQAIKQSGLEEMTGEKGLEYVCGVNGNSLSGGEKQRIGIARSIIQGSDVLLMDEATSSLDVQSGYQIIDTVQKMSGKTRIIVTHDLYPSLMQNFNCIFVMKNGSLVEQGTYSELMSREGIFYELIRA